MLCFSKKKNEIKIRKKERKKEERKERKKRKKEKKERKIKKDKKEIKKERRAVPSLNPTSLNLTTTPPPCPRR